jgi:RNA polymerase sigma factor (sigma-70 family)
MGSSAAHRRFPRALLRVASDERLVEYVRGGSETAFEAIYDRHHRGILAFSRHMLGSVEEAEDAVQHTFMAAYRHLVGADAEIQLRPWLYTIARNRCLTTLRTRRERPLDEVPEPATEHLSTEAQRRQDVRELLADVAQLPEDQRAALVLAELGDVSHDEIATVLEVPRQKVKALVFQARTSLAASRTARETPCAEIREQLANLRGGALRRTTLHRHLRECAGCRAFREEVALQRKTLAVALPVIATPGLKEAALGAAFGSGGAGGAAALSGGGALAAKALVAVALVGGGTTAGVEAERQAESPAPAAAARSAPPMKPVAAALTAPAARVVTPVRTHAKPAAPAHARRRPAAHGTPRKHAKHAPARREHVPPGQAKPVKAVPPGQTKKQAAPKAVPPGQAKAPAPKVKAVRPGQVKQATPKLKAIPPGQAKKQESVPALKVKDKQH